MKKTLYFIICLIVVFSLCSCSKDEKAPEKETNENLFSTTSEEETSEQESLFETDPTIIPAESPTEIEVEDFLLPFKNEPSVIMGEKNSSFENGREPLEKVSYSAEESSSLSSKKISHSHGPASDGKAHHTVVAFQDTFDKYGALTLDRVSEEKVLYLTFDCGWEYNNLTSTVLDVLKEKKVTAAFFCTLDHIKKQGTLINRMIEEGHIVGNHSTTHPSFADISRTKMMKEIEETENYLRENFGYCAKYFRFPAGEYTESALELVSSLGYMSVFWSVAYNDWNVDNIQGKDYAVKTVTERLHDGAVILLHSVSQDNAQALGEIIDIAREEGYVFKSLTEYGRNS
ncbi:MAG: polysaccharide deacetylase family protein [Clostridia bacterium]|nr:polysaccharide deacetylase family protein [Clostridia bacterium]